MHVAPPMACHGSVRSGRNPPQAGGMNALLPRTWKTLPNSGQGNHGRRLIRGSSAISRSFSDGDSLRAVCGRPALTGLSGWGRLLSKTRTPYRHRPRRSSSPRTHLGTRKFAAALRLPSCHSKRALRSQPPARNDIIALAAAFSHRAGRKHRARMLIGCAGQRSVALVAAVNLCDLRPPTPRHCCAHRPSASPRCRRTATRHPRKNRLEPSAACAADRSASCASSIGTS